MLPTCERLRELFDYDPDTGILTHRVTRGRSTAGATAGSRLRGRRRQVGVDGGSYLLARVIWCWVFGEWPRQYVDHRDRNPGNDRLGNLRDIGNSLNLLNATQPKRSNTTGYLGVSRAKYGGYRATLRVDGVWRDIGTFAQPEQAHAAYMAAKTAARPEVFA